MNLASWAAGFCAVSVGVHVSTLAAAARRCRTGRAPPIRAEEPPVSLLRPVCGLDNFARETLASTFAIDYPHYEVIFCVARDDDPVNALLRELIAAHPQVPARLLIGDDRVSVNPKLNNLIKGWDAAHHRWIIMADSNVLLPQDYIRRLMARWRPDTGVVCSMPVGSQPGNFWAEVECAFLNTLEARYEYVSEMLGFGFAQGKNMLFRRDVVEARGGIRALAAETAEDAATTKLVRDAGLHVHLADCPFEQPLGRRSAALVWSRQLRWARLRRVSFPLLFLPEIFVSSALPALALAYAAAASGSSAPAAVAGLLALWFGAEIAAARVAGWRCSWRLLAAMAARDLLLPALWAGALTGSGFVWRGNAMSGERAPRRRTLRRLARNRRAAAEPS